MVFTVTGEGGQVSHSAPSKAILGMLDIVPFHPFGRRRCTRRSKSPQEGDRVISQPVEQIPTLLHDDGGQV